MLIFSSIIKKTTKHGIIGKKYLLKVYIKISLICYLNSNTTHKN